jgi:hypothetical protein
MVNYQQGKIYRLVCNTTGLVYVGSTCEPTLTRRLQKHKGDYKKFLDGKNSNMTSFQILENNNYEIILIEVYPCNSKDELHQRERHYIETMECVNIQIPGRTWNEYYIDNKETILKKHRERYNQNVEQDREKIRERKRKWRESKKLKNQIISSTVVAL